MMTVDQILTCLTDYSQRAKTLRSKYPYYDRVCREWDGFKTRKGNLTFRKKCLEWATRNPEVQEQLWIMCSRDLLFFVNVCAMTFDPRLAPKSTIIPFITYEFQDVSLDEIRDAIEIGFDELTEKSRDMGASWMYLTVFVWMWLFRPYNTFRMLSRNEDLVDKNDDPDCLFWKAMFLIEHLPKWLQPTYNKVHLNLINYDNGSTITGCTTTSDAARGGRCTAMLPDEFAAVPDGHGMLSATRDVTRCRLFNSTHQGAATAFYKLSIGKIRKLVLHWSLHPVKSRGLYYSKDGKLIICDKNFRGKVNLHDGTEVMFPDDYPFRLDGKLRSPFYDVECDRSGHPMEIAQELDMDPFASDFQYFDGKIIEEIEQSDVRPPYMQGELEFDEDSLEPIGFVEMDGGPLKLWVNLDAYGHLPEDLEVIEGNDISAGTGASNTAGSFVNKETGEKIAEFADPRAAPESFAKIAVAMARWFNNAFMIWDAGGPGRTFSESVINLGYRNIYYRRNEESLSKKVTDHPGVFLNPKERSNVLRNYRRALKDKTFIQRSHEANQECLSYVYKGQDRIEHSASSDNIDPSGAGANHGDRTIADALATKAMDLFGTNNLKNENKIPTNCYAAFKAQKERKEREKNEW